MKSKVVENWLTKVNEITFTIPFSQLLLSKGQKVVHISSQGPMEQGKDVIAVDSDGTVHCYQLKCGNINERVWREIKGEIDQLVELPPKHPSLDSEVEDWACYLVTNGGIPNSASRSIQDYGEAKAKAGHRPLQTVCGTELVADFVKFYDEFLPIDVVDLQRFLEIYNQVGDLELDVERFKLFFEAHFRACQQKSRQKKVEAIRASLVLCSYLLTYKYERANHVDVIKGYTLLLASIYEFVEAQELPERLWIDTEKLVYEGIDLEFRQLIDELIEHPNDFLETRYGFLSEVVAYKVRCSELLGLLACYEITCALTDSKIFKVDALNEITSRLSNHKVLLGECFTPFFLSRVCALHLNGRDEEALIELLRLFIATLGMHTDQNKGMPNPYYGPLQVINWSLGRFSGIDETFHRMSYSLWSITLLMAAYGLREPLNETWPILSRVAMQEIVPIDKKGYLAWRDASATHHANFPDMTQSWAKLVELVGEDHSSSLPTALRNREYFWPLFMCVMPHRLNPKIILTVFNAKASPRRRRKSKSGG